MNAKKIMGAVLVALLAAALFVGAGAAANEGIPTIFVYQDTDYAGTWVSEDGLSKITFDANGVLKGDNIKAGIYTNGTDAGKVYVTYPTGEVEGYYDSTYSVIGGIVPSTKIVTFTAGIPADGITDYGLIFTSPSGVSTYMLDGQNSAATIGGSQYIVNLADVDEVGEWKVQLFFGNANGFANLPAKYLAGQDVYTFTITDTTNAVTISADSVIKGNTFKVTVSGLPGNTATLIFDSTKVAIVEGQPNVNTATNVVTIGSSGQTVVGFKAIEDGKVTIKAQFGSETKDAKITIEKGTITVSAEADFYYLGTSVKLTGTNTESGKVYLYIKGNNVDLMYLGVTADVKADDTWEKKISESTFDDFDAGTYTVYAVATPISSTDLAAEKLSEYTYAPVSLVLKQPFLTAQLSATVVAQDSELVITGTAEAADTLLLYVFGNNKFTYDNITVDNDGTYEYELDISAAQFATGQYFVVIQHPMYNEQFNIAPLYKAAQAVGQKLSYNIVLNTTADVFTAKDGSILFNTLERQSSNAAEALCQALDTQNIDDLYVKATFVVAQPTATINPVDDVAKGAKLVVSGTSNMAPGTLVTVEMLSTAFAAIPKESVNSASFITLTTKVQEDGTWAVEFDTSGLNVDEYTIGASIDSIKTPTVVVKVLESAPVTPPADDKPDTPVTPPTDEPKDEPTTPGFGALAALAGLGAVAVLLLRRE